MLCHGTFAVYFKQGDTVSVYCRLKIERKRNIGLLSLRLRDASVRLRHDLPVRHRMEAPKGSIAVCSSVSFHRVTDDMSHLRRPTEL